MKKMIMENKGKLILSSLVVVLPALLGGRMVWEILGLLAAHWICLGIVLWDNARREQSKKALDIVYWLMPMISLVMGLGLVLARQGFYGYTAFSRALMFGMGALFFVVGNQMPRFRPNSTLGIRLPWTMGNEENWRSTHRWGGKVWVVAGLAAMVAALLPTAAGARLMLAAGAAVIVLPTLYSYLYYRKQRKAGAPALTVQLKTRWAVFLVALAAVLLVGLFVTGSVSVSFDGGAMTIDADGWNDMTLPYSSIASVQYLPEGQAPEAGVRTYGFGNQKVSLGNFHNDAYGDYIRYTYDSCGSCLLLELADGRLLVLNGRDDGATQSLYRELTAKLEQ